MPTLLALLPLGCVLPNPEPAAPPPIDEAVYRRAEVDRAEQLAAEVARLREDLRQAEEVLVRAESDLRGSHSRADAVSLLAEARIGVERAGRQAPWRTDALVEARAKLAEADAQIAEGNFGAALFFIYRANRISEQLERESATVRHRPETLYVSAKLVNLRAGPSAEDPVIGVLSEGTPVVAERRLDPWLLVRVNTGSVGWVHGSLLRDE